MLPNLVEASEVAPGSLLLLWCIHSERHLVGIALGTGARFDYCPTVIVGANGADGAFRLQDWFRVVVVVAC